MECRECSHSGDSVLNLVFLLSSTEVRQKVLSEFLSAQEMRLECLKELNKPMLREALPP